MFFILTINVVFAIRINLNFLGGNSTTTHANDIGKYYFSPASNELLLCLTNSSGEVRTLLIGCLSFAGVVVLLLMLQIIGMVCFVSKNRAKTEKRKIIKTDINPVYGEDCETDGGDNNHRISNDYDYMK